MASNFPDRLGCLRMPGLEEIPGRLKIQPELRLHPKHTLQAERSIWRDPPLAVDDLVQAGERHTDPLRQFGLTDLERLTNSSTSISPGCVGARCVGIFIVTSFLLENRSHTALTLPYCFLPTSRDSRQSRRLLDLHPSKRSKSDYCWLMRIQYWPFLSPFRASSRFPGWHPQVLQPYNAVQLVQRRHGCFVGLLRGQRRYRREEK